MLLKAFIDFHLKCIAIFIYTRKEMVNIEACFVENEHIIIRIKNTHICTYMYNASK